MYSTLDPHFNICIAHWTHILGAIIFFLQKLGKNVGISSHHYIYLFSQANDIILLNIKFMCRFLQKLLTKIRTCILGAL